MNMSLIDDLLKKSSSQTTASKYTSLNGVAYLIVGAILVVWPGVAQTLFMEPAFVGHEGALMRVIGLTIVVIGWLYLFGGRPGSRQFIIGWDVRKVPIADVEHVATLRVAIVHRELGSQRASRVATAHGELTEVKLGGLSAPTQDMSGAAGPARNDTTTA
jgi:cytochrome c biogenesis protein CcdA